MQAKALEEAQRKAAEEARTREHEESRLPPLSPSIPQQTAPANGFMDGIGNTLNSILANFDPSQWQEDHTQTRYP